MTPSPLLKPLYSLTKTAKEQAEDLNASGKASHYNHKGESPSTRIRKLDSFGMVGENIDFGNSTPLDIIFNLLIDDGIKGVGHRKNILHPGFTHVGIAIGPHPEYSVLCVQDFASKTTRADETR
jgi:uncharacterized protein YkwD